MGRVRCEILFAGILKLSHTLRLHRNDVILNGICLSLGMTNISKWQCICEVSFSNEHLCSMQCRLLSKFYIWIRITKKVLHCSINLHLINSSFECFSWSRHNTRQLRKTDIVLICFRMLILKGAKLFFGFSTFRTCFSVWKWLDKDRE